MGDGEARRILVVDDESAVGRVLDRVLRGWGHIPVVRTNVDEAVEAATDEEVDVIISDICMPRMGGLDMLRLLRGRGVDSPAVLMTGQPSVSSAASAMALGVVHYLVKPFGDDELRQAVTLALGRADLQREQRQALAYHNKLQALAREASGASAELDKAIGRSWLAYQPIISFGERKVVGYEALVRSDEPCFGTADKLIAAAERHQMTDHLSRAVRSQAAIVAADLPAEQRLFVNVHPRDLLDADLLDGSSPLGKLAHRVVLELTERAALGTVVPDLGERLERLRDMGYQLAIDDLGAGHSSLSLLVELRPAVVKIDMSLVRGIDRDPVKQRVVRALVDLCRELEIEMVSEGVETLAECMTLVAEGCDLLQGYLFARPGRTFPAVGFGRS